MLLHSLGGVNVVSKGPSIDRSGSGFAVIVTVLPISQVEDCKNRIHERKSAHFFVVGDLMQLYDRLYFCSTRRREPICVGVVGMNILARKEPFTC